jgi:hypothetical protein
MRNRCKNLIGKSEGKKPLGRHRHRREGNIKQILRKYGVRIWIGFKWFKIRSSVRMS